MKFLPRNRAFRATLAAFTLAAGALLGADAWVGAQAAEHCFDELARVPEAPAALVLGCSERLPDGRANLYFARRIDAAAELYRRGKVGALIVSGDNHRSDYDEPTAMKAALIEAGVPEECIYCDFAGLRTLDSVIRAEVVFGQRRLIVVSQRFHAERAVYLARERGLEAFGYSARAVGGAAGLRTRLRELAARVVAVLDARVLDTQPRFLGPRVEVLVADRRDG